MAFSAPYENTSPAPYDGIDPVGHRPSGIVGILVHLGPEVVNPEVMGRRAYTRPLPRTGTPVICIVFHRARSNPQGST
jgi:hypothetical protein